MKNLLLLFSVLFIGCGQANKINPGTYGDVLEISINEKDNQVLGVLNMDYQGADCGLKFRADLSRLVEQGQDSITLVDSYFEENRYKAFIKIVDNGIYIQSPESIFPCQRIMDLSGGELFFKDDNN